jgi:hypothetical protein
METLDLDRGWFWELSLAGFKMQDLISSDGVGLMSVQ